jgi:hypothetical protein
MTHASYHRLWMEEDEAVTLLDQASLEKLFSIVPTYTGLNARGECNGIACWDGFEEDLIALSLCFPSKVYILEIFYPQRFCHPAALSSYWETHYYKNGQTYCLEGKPCDLYDYWMAMR